MLRASEADIAALLLVLVVLPLVTYILLGIWNETSKKKARICMLAQLAAEEALRVEAMASADVIPAGPSLKTVFHECARCFAPATTRCSRCKSVRYWYECYYNIIFFFFFPLSASLSRSFLFLNLFFNVLCAFCAIINLHMIKY